MLKYPYRMIVAGPSSSGKSSFVTQLLNNFENLTGKKPVIYWCYGNINARPKNLPNGTNFIDGMPNFSEIPKAGEHEHNVVVFDDMMNTASKSADMSHCFSTLSHHHDLSPIYITQNIFRHGREQRDITLNANYIVMMRNVRDLQQIYALARQINPEKPSKVFQLYKTATLQPWSYFIIDLNQDTPENARFLCDIFSPVPTVLINTDADLIYTDTL